MRGPGLRSTGPLLSERFVRIQPSPERKPIGAITFDRSGWFLVRAIAENERTFRFASTGPFSVEIGETTRRIGESSARFFLAWALERAERVRRNLPDAAKLAEVLAYHTPARAFWEAMVARECAVADRLRAGNARPPCGGGTGLREDGFGP